MGATRDPETRFPSGVASGDPWPDRIVLWTRAAEGKTELGWTMARDPELRDPVRSGRVTADRESGVARVDVTDLDPGTTYFYGFDADGVPSPIGRTRTLPEGPTDHLRIAVFSCAKYAAGYFNALGRIADRDDIDFVLCLGDYIYEYSNQDRGLGTEIGRAFEPDHRCATLEDYRTRYAQARSDPEMQRMHARHPIIAIPDDHEVADNRWRDGAKKHHPDEQGDWEARWEAGMTAWMEWLPARLPRSGDARHLYRSFHLGDLADLIVLDSRTHRDRQAKPPETERPERTLLGEKQLEWYADQLMRSRASWRLVANQVMVAQVESDLLPDEVEDPLAEISVIGGHHTVSPDHWDGYPGERERVLRGIRKLGIDDTVFVAGDVHSSWACDLKFDAHDPEEDSVAVELVTTSATSENLDDHAGWGYRTRSPQIERQVVEENPHIHWCELDSHGYLLVDVTPDRVQGDWYFVDTILRPSDGVRFAESYAVRRGERHLHHVGRPVSSTPERARV
jgi:alkaline phosphatase D